MTYGEVGEPRIIPSHVLGVSRIQGQNPALDARLGIRITMVGHMAVCGSAHRGIVQGVVQ
jgi:hypothetical protein